MVNESWFGGMWWTSEKNDTHQREKQAIGVLAYEVSNFMAKVVHLWQCLSDNQFARLRKEIMNSEGVRKLVSEDEDFLLQSMCGEIIENLESLAKYVARLGNKCTNPVLQRFENVFYDWLYCDMDLYGLEYTWKKMDRKVKKMSRFITTNACLNEELEVLGELERTLRRKKRDTRTSRIGLLEFQQKVVWRRQEINNLQENSVCNRTYDYTVRLLVRSLFTIFGRIKHVFGNHLTETVLGVNESRATRADLLPRSHSFSALRQSRIQPSANNLARLPSSPLGRLYVKSGSFSCTSSIGVCTKQGQVAGSNKARNRTCQIRNQSSTLHSKPPHRKVKRLAPVGPFKGCMPGGSDSPVIQSFTSLSSYPLRSNSANSLVRNGRVDDTVGSFARSSTPRANLHPCFKKKLLNAPPFTLGVAALALHYANLIIIIEKLVTSPSLIGPAARDDLYSMLPTSLRVALRARLKSYRKNSTSLKYDTDFAAQWSEALTRILEWLAPLAHNMIKWQSERILEQQHLVSRTNVLLVQTLYFADRGKTEAAITELLVGLNYLWRLAQELDAEALLECTRSRSNDQFIALKARVELSPCVRFSRPILTCTK